MYSINGISYQALMQLVSVVVLVVESVSRKLPAKVGIIKSVHEELLNKMLEHRNFLRSQITEIRSGQVFFGQPG